MQALFTTPSPGLEDGLYNLRMARRAKQSRSKQGARLAALRQAAGLTQQELASLLGEPQSNITFWEHSEKPPRSDVLAKMARIFGVRVEALLNTEADLGIVERKSGPAGKVRKVFEAVSKLPRRQQEKIVEFVSAYVQQYAQNRQS